MKEKMLVPRPYFEETSQHPRLDPVSLVVIPFGRLVKTTLRAFKNGIQETGL